MFEIASLIVVNLIIAAIIGFIAGYLIGRPRTAKIDSIENPNGSSISQDSKSKAAINPVFCKNV